MSPGEAIVYAQHLRDVARERDASAYPKSVKPDVPVGLFSWPEYRELADAIDAALAASGARVEELEREVAILCVPPSVERFKVLTAKLEASESSIRSVCEIAQVDGLDDLAAKLQAGAKETP